ncbi:MAG: GatB/YqeY domain-containing protein [Hyphomicrobiaceae bacterium]|nr:GatB/YqeY domain-containing protein [Hyphomicrobiaceae bacterium]
MLREKLTADLKDAMRGGDKLKVSTIRLITSAIKSADIEARPSGKDQIDEGSIVNVMTKMIKQRRDSVEQYVKGNRQDLADKELGEIAIIEGYLPQQMDDTAMKTAIAKAIADTGAASGKDMGKVMGALKAAFAGQMDFGKAGGIVKDLLNK